MGLKLSSNNPPRMRTYSSSSPGTSGGNSGIAIARAEASNSRTRARSLGSFQAGHSPTLGIPTANGGAHRSNSPDSDSSTPDDMPLARTFAHSLPVHLFALQGLWLGYQNNSQYAGINIIVQDSHLSHHH